MRYPKKLSQIIHNTDTKSAHVEFNFSYMDMDALHSVLLSIGLVSEKLRRARETADADQGLNLRAILVESEKDLRMAKATLAAELGFSLCPRCWPPELVSADRDGRINCPACGRISFDRAA